MSGRIRFPVADLGLVCAAWGLLTAAVVPFGNFPLNDDWSYARSVQTLLDEQRIDLVYAAVPLITQIAWGALFSLPFGVSFTALQVSTWTLGLVGLIATYLLLSARNASRSVALLGTLLLAVNPFYLSLSLTFMTDVPFVALSVASIVFLAGGLRRDSRWRLGIGFALLVLALLVRQPAIAVAVGFGVAYVLTRPRRPSTFILGALPTAASLGVLIGYEQLMRRTVGLPPLYNNPFDPIGPAAADAGLGIASVVISRAVVQLLYLGLLTLPVSLLAAGSVRRTTPSGARTFAVVAVAVGSGAIGLWLMGGAYPLGNVVYDLGIGPPLLRDVYLLGLPRLPKGPEPFWMGVTLASVAGVAAFVLLGASAWRAGPVTARLERLDPAVTISAVTGLVSAAFLVVAGFLDRYLLLLVPLALTCVVAAAGPEVKLGRPWWATATALVIAMTLFTVAGTHDYLSWNRARWAALNHLSEELRVTSSEIDGGYEFYGWYRHRPASPEGPVSGWSRSRAEYVLAFGPIDGYSELLRLSYPRWLPPGAGEVVVLRRSGNGAGD